LVLTQGHFQVIDNLISAFHPLAVIDRTKILQPFKLDLLGLHPLAEFRQLFLDRQHLIQQPLALRLFLQFRQMPRIGHVELEERFFECPDLPIKIILRRLQGRLDAQALPNRLGQIRERNLCHPATIESEME